MDDDRPERRKRQPPYAVLGMLLLVAVVEMTLARLASRLMDRTTLDWVETGRAARGRSRDRAILCFGDSLNKFGILPSVIAGSAARRAYNLAPAGGQAPSSYFLLRRALEAGAKPEVIVVDFSPPLLQQGPRRVLRQWPALIEARELIDLALASGSEPLIRPMILASTFPSIRARDEIRDAVRDRAEAGRMQAPHFDYRRVWAENDGAQPTPRRRASFTPEDLGRVEEYPKRAWTCHPLNEAYLRRFLRLARDRGIPVVWLLPPVSPAAQARRERLGVDRFHIRFVRRLQDEFPGVVVVDGRHSGYDGERFVDPVHLDRDGAADLSAALRPLLITAAAGEEGGSWRDLPAPPEGLDPASNRRRIAGR